MLPSVHFSQVSLGKVIKTTTTIITIIIIIIITAFINLFNVDNQNMQIMCIVINSHFQQACQLMSTKLINYVNKNYDQEICYNRTRNKKNLSARGNVCQGCVWSGKCLSGKCPSGKYLVGEVSGRGNVRWGCVRWESVRQGSVRRGCARRGTVRTPLKRGAGTPLRIMIITSRLQQENNRLIKVKYHFG